MVKAVEGLSEMKPDCVILAVAHEEFKGAGLQHLEKVMKDCPAVVDVKGMFGKCRNLTL